jgi:transcriptional regulator with XRE-family HTH domain
MLAKKSPTVSRRHYSETFYSRPFIRIALKIAAERGLTLDDLAARTAIRRGRLARYERGTAEPWIDDIFLVAKALDVSPIWFFSKILAEGHAARAARMRSGTETETRP